MESTPAEEEKKEIPPKEEEQKDEEDDGDNDGPEEGGAKKKKKKNKKKKKKTNNMFQDNSQFRLLGNWQEREGTQVWPDATVTIQDQFPEGDFPPGQTMEYNDENRD